MIFFSFAVTTISGSFFNDTAYLDCGLLHLNKNDPLEVDIEYTPQITDPRFCNGVLNTLSHEFAEEFVPMDRTSKFANCLNENVGIFDLINVHIKMLVYEKATNLSEPKYNEIYNTLKKRFNRTLTRVREICDGDNFFGSEFDKKVQHPDGNFTANLTLQWKQRVYCIRKGMIEENWINGSLYNVPLNPYNVDISNIDCNEIFGKFKNDVQDGVERIFAQDFGVTSPIYKERISYFMKKRKFGQNFSKMIVLGRINLSDEEKARERAAYIKYMNEFYNTAFAYMSSGLEVYL